jgi:CDP-glycerol glycerophosphotransferase
MPLISVVIPVHGVEDYLDRCLDTVLNNSGLNNSGLNNFRLGEPAVPIEVIAVDDASPDRCGEILAARRDSRLRVITTPAPVGPGPARDLGAKEATGEYVWFVDGDDELAEEALAAVAGALREQPDVLIVDFENLYPDGTTSPSDGAKYLRGPRVATLADDPALIHLTMTAWSKVFRRDYLCGLDITFASSGPAPHEDVPVTTMALLTAKRIAVLDRVCYRYRRARRGSFLTATSEDHFNIFRSYQQIFNILAERGVVSAPIPAPVVAAIFERAIWHYTTLLPLVPKRRRREFFHQMSIDFRRWRPREPAGFSFPPGLRGVKFRLVARDAYWAYALLDPLNRLRVALRSSDVRHAPP